MNKNRLLTREGIIITVCGDCPFEGRFSDEDYRACQRQLGKEPIGGDLLISLNNAEWQALKSRFGGK